MLVVYACLVWVRAQTRYRKGKRELMRLPTRLAGVATLGLLVTLAACGSNSSTPAPSSSGAPASSAAPAATSGLPACPPSGSANSLTGAGSTFDAPLFAKQFDTYNTQCKVQVNYQSVGSGAGVQQMTAKTVNFGASDAPMTDDQIKAAGGDILHIPITIGPVSVGYNLPGVKSGVKLTGDVLAKIYLGTITKWNDPAITQLNSGMNLPSLQIAVVHRSDASGTSFIFTNYLSAVNADWKSKVGAGTAPNWPTGAGGKGSEGVAGLVEQTPGGIGYFELSSSAQNNITVASMQNANGKYVAPTPDAASAAAAGAAANLPPDLRAIITNPTGDATYPISGFSWVLINQGQSNQAAAQSLVYLLWWMTHQGQQFSTGLSYAPLPDAVVRADETQLRKVTVDGKPVLPPQ